MNVKLKLSTLLIALFILACGGNKNKKDTQNPISENQQNKMQEELHFEGFQNDAGDVLRVAYQEEGEVAVVEFQNDQFHLKKTQTDSGTVYSVGPFLLVQKNGETILKRDEEIIFKQSPKLLKGKLTIDGEVQSIIDCISGMNYYINDISGTLLQKFEEVSSGEPVSATLKGIDKQMKNNKELAEFNGKVDLVEVIEIKELEENFCK